MFYQNAVDAYGFKRPSDFDYVSYETFMENYFTVLQRRALRWKQVLGDVVEKEKLKRYLQGRQFKRFVRKGIPRSHRALVWMVTSGAQDRMETQPNRFVEMLQCPRDREAMEQIELDLHRTFPDNIYFKEKSGEFSPNDGNKERSVSCEQPCDETELDSTTQSMTRSDKHKLQQLKNVLTAFAHHNPTVGYCQGLNFISGLLLLIVEDEECAFWLLDALVNHILPDYYSKDMVGLRADTRSLGELVATKMSDVSQAMITEGVTWELVASRWLLCLYIDVLPVETVLRIWDVLFNEGSKIIFRVAITLIKNAEPKLLTCQNFPSIVTTFKAMSDDPLALHCHAFMSTVFEITKSLSSKTIEELREESKKIVKEQDALRRM